MRILRATVLFALWLMAAWGVRAQRGTQADTNAEAVKHGHHYVVAIGIDHYENWPVLSIAESDAAGFAELLTRQFGFEFAADPLSEKSATRDHINSLIDDELRRKLKPEDDLVFFFAGHGTTRKDRVGERTEAVGFLVPVDAHAPGGDEHWSDYINVDELLRKISTLSSEHILVVLDSCHSGIALGGKFTSTRTDTRFEQDMLRKVSRKVITSAEADQLAADNGPLDGHSLFTGLMMQGLTSGSADRFGQGFITSTQLGAYTQHEVGAHEGSRQTPLFGSFDLDDGGELIIPLGTGNAQSGSKTGLTQLEQSEVLRISQKDDYWYNKDAAENYPAARSAVLKLCDGGDAWGCWQAARSLQYGRGGGKDFARAVELARLGCQRNLADSCVTLGVLYRDGETIEPDPASAVRIFQDACDQGSNLGCEARGEMYAWGSGVEKSNEKAEVLLKRACDGGLRTACNTLANLYGMIGAFDRAVPIFKKICDAGDAGGCLDLGWKYEEGNGVGKDIRQAVSLFRKACDGDDLGGCAELARFYRNGEIVPKSIETAFTLAQRSCKDDETAGCTLLGEMYEKGESTQADVHKAVELYKKACVEGRNSDGCWDLGRMYQAGTVVPKDLIQAATLYRRGCDWNVPQGCTALGVLYETGEGLSKDVEEARKLYKRGCGENYSDPAACEHLKALPPASKSQ